MSESEFVGDLSGKYWGICWSIEQISGILEFINNESKW